MVRPTDPEERKLPFPTRPLRVGGDVVEEYIIPDDKKQEVLEQLYLFEGVPGLDEQLFDLHEGKLFTVREYRVTWERGHNWLVSPYYPSSGGTVIDWLPPEAAEDDGPDDELGDEDGLDGLFEDDDQ
jgi:hypothetical protein